MWVRRCTAAPLAALVLLAVPGQATGQDHDAMIRNALSAAPASVASGATVALPTGDVLHEGSNGFVCLPDDPDRDGNSPMCLDAQWQAWAGAWMSQEDAPEVSGMGIGYMLQGDFPASNTDPFATGPTDDNEWMPVGVPHVMILVSDPAELEGISTDPNNGGPWVMWRGTPYVHLMIPSAPTN